ncbi:hypothetical protein Sste5346_005971 [Sporothrix stenoceras]|uniref:Alpha/beta hydrolase fold-3 domain-containing protein n=1 Tax=Sporothrix stenoceras TaxID=5173 RepID=A0ABR3Z1M0_9PEZI
MTSHTLIPFDKELVGVLQALGTRAPLCRQSLGFLRRIVNGKSTAEAVLIDPEIAHEARTIDSPDGRQLDVAILRRKDFTAGPLSTPPSAAVYFIHGGGMVAGTRFSDISALFGWIKACNIVMVSVEYRLAPEHPYPAALEDCYAGLQWLFASTSELHIDPRRIILAGASAGGGLAAGVALLSRDRGGPRVMAQCLMYPMLDHTTSSASSKQYMTEGLWTGASNIAAWDMYLAGVKEGDHERETLVYAVPGRAADVSGLAQTFIDVGSAEPFRDEDINFAQKLSEQGVPVELHVWPGAWHGFDQLVPTAQVSQDCAQARLAWLKRVLRNAK